MEKITLPNGYNRNKTPEMLEFRKMTREETLAVHGTIWIVANDGKARNVKVTSVKTWKRSPDRVEIGLKYGMYEFATFNLAEAMERFLVRVEGE